MSTMGTMTDPCVDVINKLSDEANMVEESLRREIADLRSESGAQEKKIAEMRKEREWTRYHLAGIQRLFDECGGDDGAYPWPIVANWHILAKLEEYKWMDEYKRRYTSPSATWVTDE